MIAFISHFGRRYIAFADKSWKRPYSPYFSRSNLTQPFPNPKAGYSTGNKFNMDKPPSENFLKCVPHSLVQ